MDFTSKLSPELAASRLILEAILLSLLGIFLLIVFIAGRRWQRGRYFQKLNRRTFSLRSRWDDIIDGTVPAQSWRLDRFDCEIVEAILLDNLETATPEELPRLLHCLRSSGLLDMRIRQAREASGWKQQSALVALGRTRAREAVPALAAALNSSNQEIRLAAVRGLGRTGLPDAALPILDHLLTGRLNIPEHVVKNALASCCRSSAAVLLQYLRSAAGASRQIIARAMAEVATADLGEDLILLAGEPDPELRASAARVMGKAQPAFAFPVLSVLAADKEWFVRLRAVVALAGINHKARIRPLLRALCDSNRLVRQRAAWALTQMDANLSEILSQVVETQDNYALQAFISELERTGAIDQMINDIEEHRASGEASEMLLQALNSCRARIEQSSKAATAVAGAR
jgi:HEAT repeat protein